MTTMYTHTYTHQVKEVYNENDSIGEDVEFYPEESTPSMRPVQSARKILAGLVHLHIHLLRYTPRCEVNEYSK